MTVRMKWKGSGIRKITEEQFAAAGIEGAKPIHVDTRLGDTARLVEVDDEVATLLLERDPAEWEVLEDEAVAKKAEDKGQTERQHKEPKL